jgi:hypothetical protein
MSSVAKVGKSTSPYAPGSYGDIFRARPNFFRLENQKPRGAGKHASQTIACQEFAKARVATSSRKFTGLKQETNNITHEMYGK